MFFSKKDIANIKYFALKSKTYITMYHDEAKKIFDDIDANTKNNLTIINVDQHSDIHINIRHQDVTYANWLNFLFLENKINCFYWLYPKNIIKKKKKLNWGAGPLSVDNNILRNGKLTQKFFLDRKNFEIISEEKIEKLNNNCLEFNLEKLYDISELEPFYINIINSDFKMDFSSKNIFLTIDADFFSTNDDKVVINLYRKYKLYKDFKLFLKFMKLQNIQPTYIVMTYSPNYINKKDKDNITSFFNLIKKWSLN